MPRERAVNINDSFDVILAEALHNSMISPVALPPETSQS